jgi:hypothetical protein
VLKYSRIANEDAIRGYIESLEAHGEPILEPLTAAAVEVSL